MSGGLCPALFHVRVFPCGGECPPSRRASPRVNIVQECEQEFPWKQLFLHLLQSIVDRQTEQEGHQRVTLFPSFSLADVMMGPVFINPLVARITRMRGPDIRE